MRQFESKKKGNGWMPFVGNMGHFSHQRFNIQGVLLKLCDDKFISPLRGILIDLFLKKMNWVKICNLFSSLEIFLPYYHIK